MGYPATRALADAFVRIRPDAAGFGAETEAKVRAALSGITGDVKITASTDAAMAKVTALRTAISALSKEVGTARATIDVNDKAAQAKLAKIASQLLSLDRTTSSPNLTLSGAVRVEAQLLALEAAFQKFDETTNAAKPRITIDDASALAKVTTLRASVADLMAKITAARGTIDLNDTAAQAKLASMFARLSALQRTVATPEVFVKGVPQAEAQLLGLLAAFKSLQATHPEIQVGTEVGSTVGKLAALNAVLNSTSLLINRGGGMWGFLTTKVALFGGALSKVPFLGAVSGIHLITEAIAETIAIVVPAGVALTAFGVAGARAGTDIYQRMTSVVDVMDATGKTVPPLTGAFQKLGQAVAPDVFQLFGDALTVINNKTGEFASLAKAAGAVVDTLAARATVAFTSGGISAFLRNAIPDLQMLGDVIGNIFGTVGNLLKALPDYAVKLLTVLDTVTKALEAITASPIVQFIARLGLAFHGLILYTGLAVTGFVLLARWISGLAVTITEGIVAMVGWAAATITAAGATTVFEAALALLGAVPVIGWITAAVTGLALLVIWLSRSKTSVQQLTDSMQKATLAASNLQAINVAANNLAVLTQQSDAAKQSLGSLGDQAKTVGVRYAGINMAFGETRVAVQQLGAGMQQQITDIRNVAGGAEFLREKYHITGQEALALADIAGVKLANGITGSGNAALIAQQKIAGLVSGYGAAAAQANILGADVNAMTFAQELQATQIGKLNSAWSTFIGTVTGGSTAFDTFQEGMATLNQNFLSAAGGSGSLTVRLKNLQASGKTAGATMDGLSVASLSLNAAFMQQVTNADSVLAAFRLQGASSQQLTRSTKDLVSELLPFAKGSQDATAAVYALAQEAGYHGVDSFKALKQWLGNTHNGAKDLRKESDLLAGSIANLAADAKNLSDTLKNDLNQMLVESALKTYGVSNAMLAYTQDIKDNTTATAKGRQDRQNLINDIIHVGTVAGDSKGAIAEMISTILHIPYKVAMQLVMDAQGKYSVVQIGPGGQSASIPSPGPGKPGAYFHPALGGRVPGYGGGDHVPALLEPGEAVVPKRLVPIIWPWLKANKVPGFAAGPYVSSVQHFASGGLVSPGYLGAGTAGVTGLGNYELNSSIAFRNQFIAATAAALKNALVQSERQTALAMSAGGGGNVSAYSALGAEVLAMLGQPARDLSFLLSQMNTESGGNPAAVNLSDSNAAAGHPSVGLMQVISGTYAGYGAPKFGYPAPVAYGVSENALANIYAGMAYAVARYGSDYGYGPPTGWTQVLGHGHGYDRGGMLPTGASLAINNTGSPEMITPMDKLDEVVGAVQDSADAITAAISALISVTAGQADATGQAVGSVLNGVSRRAGYAALYNSRP